MKEIKDIAVYLDVYSDQEKLLDATRKISSNHGANVTGIYTIEPMSTYIAVSSDGSMPGKYIDQLVESQEKEAEETRRRFEKSMEKAGLKTTWKCEEGSPVEIVSRYFRYADVGMLGQPKSENLDHWKSSINDIVLACGRPVMIVPYIGAGETIGKKVIIGWNESKEAARAVHDALPILENAEWVEVLDVSKHKDTEQPAKSVQLQEHLSRHGVNVRARSMTKTELDVGDVLLNQVSVSSADLVITGAWGHSRATEYVFGGVTRKLLRHMTVPVWMSH